MSTLYNCNLRIKTIVNLRGAPEGAQNRLNVGGVSLPLKSYVLHI